MEKTFAIIKPDAFAAGNAGKILDRIYAEGFKVVGLKKSISARSKLKDFTTYIKSVPFLVNSPIL